MKLKFMMAVLFCASITTRSLAQDEKSIEEPPTMVVVPPIITREQNVREDAQLNSDQIMEQVMPRIVKDGIKKKWPFKIVLDGSFQSAHQLLTGSAFDTKRGVKFSVLKPISDKIGARYLLIVKIKELTSSYYVDFFSGQRIRGRASADVYVYDSTGNELIWGSSMWATTDHPKALSADVGLRREQDGALNKCLTASLEPFAKGQRKKVTFTNIGMVASVQKVLADGKRVLLDVGREKGIVIGESFTSIESNAELKVTEILENGCIAEIVSGSPKEKEVFKTKQ